MRLALLAAATLLPLAAHAEPAFRDVVKQPARHALTGTQTSGFTDVSRIIYLNNCLPNGCDVAPGFDNSLTDHSSIPDHLSHLNGWPWGQDNWAALVQCMKDMYGPFDITITDVDPGQTPHFEVMFGGNSTDIGIQGAGGVAPFEPCDGQLQDNVISFVFAQSTSNQDFLCWAGAQESAHVFGLDHLLNAKDPMTYIAPPYKKEGFQNTASKCGEDQPRECWCGGVNTENSYQYLMDTFGPSHLDPASLTISTPADGAWVKPGFPLRGVSMSQLSVRSGALAVDGAPVATVPSPPLAFNAPASVTAGDHTFTMSATDAGDRTYSADVHVHVIASCEVGSSCDGGFKCLGGLCLPAANVPGGLGATCTDNGSCITDACGSDGSQSLCTAPCDPGNKCPSGFECTEAGAGGVCWPSQDTGGCSTGSGPGPMMPIVGLGVFLLMIRRRK
jgi:uncharacterized protein (TIGR03382 family)